MTNSRHVTFCPFFGSKIKISAILKTNNLICRKLRVELMDIIVQNIQCLPDIPTGIVDSLGNSRLSSFRTEGGERLNK